MSLASAPELTSAEDALSGDTAPSTDYVPLEVVGCIQERTPIEKTSAPQLKATSFPVARHRSERSQQAPGAKDVLQDVDVGDEDFGVEDLAKYAQPLQRREKPRSFFRKSRVAAETEVGGAGAACNTEFVVNPGEKFQDGKNGGVTSGVASSISEAGPEHLLSPSAVGLEAGLPEPDQVVQGLRERSLDLLGKRAPNGKAASDLQTIDSENRAALFSMSASEVEDAQAELRSRIRPDILEMLRKRGEAKEKSMRAAKELHAPELEASHSTDERSEQINASGSMDMVARQSDSKEAMGLESSKCSAPPVSSAWTSRVEAVRLLKFDLEGRVVGREYDDSADLDTVRKLKGDALRVAERDPLRSEGDPAALGYSILEASALARSTVAGQRSVAIRLIAAVLNRATAGLLDKDVLESPASQKAVDWQAIWAYALGPEPNIALTLRLALDDAHKTVVSVCAKALQALLSCTANESFCDAQESLWPGDRPSYTAPVFRKHTKQDEGFIGGGRWKYNVKSSEMFVEGRVDEKSETVGDDATVACKDVAAGLIRTGILPRIRYILEVDKNVAAEEALLDVVISLARHSPAGAAAVMKCPRLMDTIIQQYLASDENMVVGIRPVHTKAIRLLKVLSQASLSNCVSFAESGALQVAQTELFQQAYLLPTRSRVNQEYIWGLCSTLIEALRLWRVCIAYGIGIFLFREFYPALCFWLAPFPEAELSGQRSPEAFSLTQESFSLLERLARTLPVMHPNGGATEIDESATHNNWSWAVAVPLVKTALEWLSADSLSRIVAHLPEKQSRIDKLSSEDSLFHDSRKYLVGSLAGVLHFLSTVCGRILPEGCSTSGTASKFQSSAPWLPSFVPEIGLAIVNSRLLDFTGENASELGPSLAQILLGMRTNSDNETTAITSSCLHGIVRLVMVVDDLIQQAKPQEYLPQLVGGFQSVAHSTLATGLVVCGEEDMRHLLTSLGNEVLVNQKALQSVELRSRGGPAPGLRIGWGCTGAGAWSKQILSAKVISSLVLELLQLRNVRAKGIQSECAESYQGLDSALRKGLPQIQSGDDEHKWRFLVGMGIAALAGPGEEDKVKRVLSTVLLDATAWAAMSENAHVALKLWRNSKKIDDDLCAADISSELDANDIRKFLFHHLINTWLLRKPEKNREKVPPGSTQTKMRTASPLPRIDEDTSRSTEDFKSKLGREWSGQRLPLPAHWFLSPLAADLSPVHGQTTLDHNGMSKVANGSSLEETTSKSQKVMVAGLVFLLGVEGITAKLFASPLNDVCTTSLARKVHALSTVYVSGGDTFLSGAVRDLIGTLQEIYGHQLDSPCSFGSENILDVVMLETPPACQRLLDFEDIDASYVQFAETLAQSFAADSYGDVVFARQVAFYLRRDVADSIRVAVWQILAEAKVLHLLPPFEICGGQQAAYLYPPETNEKILDAYLSAWTAGLIDKAAALGSMSFFLALHHVAGYVFGEGINTEESAQLRKTAAKSLLRNAVRRPQQLSMLRQLISYQVTDTTRRWLFLSEAAAGDKSLLAQIESMKDPQRG